MTTKPTPTVGTVTYHRIPGPAPKSLVTAWRSSLRSEATRRGYSVDMATFARYCQEHDLDVLSVDRDDMEVWTRHLEAEYRPSTVVRKLAAVSSFYEFAVDRQLIPVNPVSKVKRPTVHADDQQLTPSRTVEEFRSVIEVATAPRDRALLLVLGVMGLRVSEALALDLGTVEMDRGHATVVVTGKGGRRSRVVVPPPVIAAFDAVAADENRVDGPVFARDGVRWNRSQAARALARLGRRAGLDGVLRPHQLRATAITVALELGEPLHKVQTFARHASPVTTRRYDANRQNLDGSPAYALAAAFA